MIGVAGLAKIVKPLAVAVVAASALAASALAACGTKDNGGAIDVPPGASATTVTAPAGVLHAKLPAAVAAAGTLRVGTAFGRAPLEFQGGGQAAGIEPDLVKALGRVLGVTVTFSDVPLSELAASVADRRVDVALAGLADRPSNRGRVVFVDYLRGASALLVRTGNPSHLRGAADLCGSASVGVVADTPSAQALAVPCGTPHLLSALRLDDLLGRLGSGQIGGIVDDSLVVSYTAQTSVAPNEFQAVGVPFGSQLYGLAVAADAPALRDAVQAALSELLSDGSYGQILARWGAGANAVTAITVNGGA